MDELILVYHPKCQASNKILGVFSQLEGLNVTLINIYEKDIESNIEITKVPTLIVNNEKMLVGREVFDYCQNIITKNEKPVEKEEEKHGMFGPTTFIPQKDAGKGQPPKM